MLTWAIIAKEISINTLSCSKYRDNFRTVAIAQKVINSNIYPHISAVNMLILLP